MGGTHPATITEKAQAPHEVALPLHVGEKQKILDVSEDAELYREIIKLGGSPDVRKRIVSVLSFLEIHRQHRPIGNYQGWLRFLRKSGRDQINHRIFEGLYAAYLLSGSDLKVSFEPKSGFFSSDLEYPRKSMDVELRLPATGEVLGYREVKRSSSFRAAFSALESSFGKAEVAKKFGPAGATLGTVIFLETGRIKNEQLHRYDEEDFAGLQDGFSNYFKEEFVNNRGVTLNDAVVIYLDLNQFFKLSINDQGEVQTQTGDIDAFQELEI